MKNQPLFYLLFFCVISYAQEKRKLVTGKVFYNDDVIADVHIVNKNSNQGTSSNDFGLFEIPITVGDVLEFSHLNLEKEKIIITQENLMQEILIVKLKGKTYVLEEIVLEKPRSIFYVDPEIMPPVTVNAKTLNLPYANTKAKKDHSVLKFRSGGVVSIDNLFNALNGNNKRRKELNKITYEDNVLSEIRKHFTDDFFITDLKIKQENINPFLNYCFKKNIINYFNKKDNIRLTKILMQESRTFPKDRTEISLLQKN